MECEEVEKGFDLGFNYKRAAKKRELTEEEQKSKTFLWISLIIRSLGVFIFFVLFELAFFFLLATIGPEFWEIWTLQVTVCSGFAIFILSTFSSGNSKIMKCYKVFVSLVMCLLFTGLLLIVLFWFERLITLAIFLFMLVIYYIVNIYLIMRSSKFQLSHKKWKSLILIFIILVSSTGITFLISLSPHKIGIQPKTNPELIFWCSSDQLPDDSDTLDMCQKYNISFMPTIRSHYAGDVEKMEAYKRIIAHGINLYFAIGADTGFFTNIDNVGELPSIYENIRQWFADNGIMDNPYVKGFAIDAEPPKKSTESMSGEYLDAVNYGMDNYPSRKKLNNATKALKEFTDMIKSDGKEYAMIQAFRYLDNADDDGDMTLFMRNIYTLPIKWDYTITMLYRTNPLQYDETGDGPPEFYLRALSLFLGAVIEGTKFTTSELSFYQNVAMEENSGDDLADEHYVFVGNFKKEFKNTTYITEKSFYKDLDICRHFGNDKVFFYDLKGFLYHYGWEGIEELGRYNQERKASYLEYSNYKSITFLTFYCGLILIDIFASLEKDLVK